MPNKNNKNLGNPLLIANALQNKDLQKGVGNSIKVIGAIAIVYGGAKYINQLNISRLEKQAFSNPDIKAAIDIYKTIPAGLKKGKGGFFSPFGFVKDAGNTIARLWQSTDTERLMKIAPYIKNIKKVSKYFKKLYGENLYTLLTNSLDKNQLSLFLNYTKSGGSSASESQTIAKNLFPVCNKSSGVFVRSTPIVESSLFSNNKIGLCEYGKVPGITTGVEKLSDDGETIFVEIKYFNPNTRKFDKIGYTWKGGYAFASKNAIENKYGSVARVLKIFDND